MTNHIYVIEFSVDKKHWDRAVSIPYGFDLKKDAKSVERLLKSRYGHYRVAKYVREEAR